MSRTTRLVRLGLLLLLCSTFSFTQSFSTSVRVYDPTSPDAQTGSEPSILIGSDNKIYVSVPDARVRLWRSDNAGVSWLFLGRVDGDITGLFGDSDLEFDSSGRLFVDDLLDLSSVISRYSDPGTMTNAMQRDFRTFTQPGQDRQWLATFPSSLVYLAFHDVGPENVWVATSFDDGQNFLPAVPAITDPVLLAETIPNTNDGRVHTDKRTGAVYVLFAATTPEDTASNPPFGPHRRLILARSFDNGLTWEDFVVFEGPAGTATGNIFPAFAIDRSGNLYAVFAANLDRNLQITNTLNIFFSRSTNQGQTWSRPIQVNSDTGSHVFPAAVGGCSGKVDIAWYGTDRIGNPNTFPNDAANAPNWNVYFAQTLNGLSSTPTFVQSKVSDHIMHRGQISTGGLTGNADRRLLDFFEVDYDTNGMAHTVWADTGTTLSGAAQVWYAHQTTGDGVLGCSAPVPLADASGGGFIVVSGNKNSFGFNVFHESALTASGYLTYQDKAGGTTFKSAHINSVSRNGNTAVFGGDGLINNVVSTTFTVSVMDNGEPGSNDTFSITLGTTGYNASGTLGGGNIEVRK